MLPESEGEPQVTWAWLFRLGQLAIAATGFVWLAAQVYWDVGQLKKDVSSIQLTIQRVEAKIEALPQVQGHSPTR